MYFNSHIIIARWAVGKDVSKNWGDKLNSDLIYRLSGSPVAHARSVLGWGDRPVFRVIGSGLGWMTSADIVWGMGFIDGVQIPAAAPAEVCAVRGPRSRDRLLELGMSCPEIYGDPAILYPLIYWPTVEKKYRYGVIQHFREFGQVDPVRIPDEDSVLHIDICGEIRTVIDEILSCEIIVSSSLHGLICAHSYGIPAYWLKASDLPVGDDFKFHDYYASIGHDAVSPAYADESGRFHAGDNPPAPGNPLIDAEKLLKSCPFMSPMQISTWIRQRRRLAKQGRKGIIF